MSTPIADLQEERFGSLIAKKIVGKDRYGMVWECHCDCGNLTTCSAARLRTGRKKSCGCRKKGKGHHLWSGHGGITGANWAHIKAHAKTRNLLFEVTIEQAWDLFQKQDGKCALSGEAIYLAVSSKELLYERKNTASLDRIDSKKGYVPGNVQWVHKAVNQMKWDAEQNNFVYWCKKIANHNKAKINELSDYYNASWENRQKQKR